MIVHTGLGIPRKNLRGIYIRSGVRQRSWGKTNVYGKRGLKRGTHQFGDAGRYLFIYRCGFLQRRTFGILGTGEWMTAVNLWMGDRNSERLDRRQVTHGTGATLIHRLPDANCVNSQPILPTTTTSFGVEPLPGGVVAWGDFGPSSSEDDMAWGTICWWDHLR